MAAVPFARIARAALPLLLAVTPSLGAQTKDQERLIIGAAIGYTGGSSLWSVPNQTILSQGILPDVFGLRREIRANVGALGHATLYPGKHIGYTAEMSYIGVGTKDYCTHVTASGDPVNAEACRRLDELSRPASAVALSAGLVARAVTNWYLHPYVKVLAGATIMPRSTVLTRVAIGQESDSIVSIYTHEGNKTLKPIGTLGIGVSTAANPGYQINVELRGNWMRLPIVTGPTARQDLEPPTGSKWVMLPQVVVGFSIVLEKKRGRRY